MKLAVRDRQLRNRLASSATIRRAWGPLAGQVELVVALLVRVETLGDLLPFRCLDLAARPGGVDVGHESVLFEIALDELQRDPVERGPVVAGALPWDRVRHVNVERVLVRTRAGAA